MADISVHFYRTSKHMLYARLIILCLLSLGLLLGTSSCEELVPIAPGVDRQLVYTSITPSGQLFQVLFIPRFSSDTLLWAGINANGAWQPIQWSVNDTDTPYQRAFPSTNGIYQIDEERIAVLNRSRYVITIVETSTGRVIGDVLLPFPATPSPIGGFANDPYMGFTALEGFWVNLQKNYQGQLGNSQFFWRANQNGAADQFNLNGSLETGKYDPETDQFFFFQDFSVFFPSGAFGQAHLFDFRLATNPQDIQYGSRLHASNILFNPFGRIDTSFLFKVAGIWPHQGNFYGLDTLNSTIVRYDRALPNEHSFIQEVVERTFAPKLAGTQFWQFQAGDQVHIVDNAQNWLVYNHLDQQVQVSAFPYLLKEVQASNQFWYCLTQEDELYRYNPTTLTGERVKLGKWDQISKMNVRLDGFVLLVARERAKIGYSFILLKPDGSWVEVMTDLAREPDMMIH